MDTDIEKPELPGAFSLFKPSWRAVRVNLEVFTVQIVMPFVVVALGGALVLLGQHLRFRILWELIGTLALLAGLGLFLMLVPMLTYTQLLSSRGVNIRYGELLRQARPFLLRMWGLALILCVLIGGGILLLVAPGLFAWQRFLYAPYLLMDKNLGVFEAMRQSAALAKQYNHETWAVVGVQLVIETPSFIVPVFGSFLSAALGIAYYCAPVVRYRELQEIADHKKTAQIAAEKAEKSKTSTAPRRKVKAQARTKKSS